MYYYKIWHFYGKYQYYQQCAQSVLRYTEGGRAVSTDKPQAKYGKQRRGRPHKPPERARPNRIVTFVTDLELQALEQIADEEDRSMAGVVHRIIAAHFNDE